MTGAPEQTTAALRAGIAARGARPVLGHARTARRSASTSRSRPAPGSRASRSRRRPRRTCCSRSPTARAGATAAHTQIVGDREVDGSVTSGHFCDTPGTYTLYFDAQFDRPFTRVATWNNARVHVPAPDAGPARTRARRSPSTRRAIAPSRMKVGISFVSVDSARAEPHRREPGLERRRGRTRRDESVERDARPHRGERRHARPSSRPSTPRSTTRCCTPTCSATTTVSTPGFDGKVHTATGYTQYANFSGWDTYRSEVQLLALLAAREPAT